MKSNFLKKLSLLAVGCSIALSSVSAFAVAEKIIIDGETLEIPAEMGQIREIDDRTFLPVRHIAESLNCEVNFQEITYTTDGVSEPRQSVTMTERDTKVSYLITIGDKQLYTLSTTGAEVITMDTEAFIAEDDRTYIPVRFFAEALGYEVGWDEATQTVTLTSK